MKPQGASLTYPTQQDVLDATPLLPWIDEHFIRPDPFAFRGKRYKDFVTTVSREFDVDPNGVFCIGSGAIGLSLNPGKITDGALRPFYDGSDFDIAIISEVLFETAWRDLRRATQPTLAEVDRDLKEAMKWQKKRLFDGAILATQVVSWLSFGPQWTSSLVRLSEQVAIEFDREIDVNIWIYRDYWSVRNYVSESIMRCRIEMA